MVADAEKLTAELAAPVAGTVALQLTVQVWSGCCWLVRAAMEVVFSTEPSGFDLPVILALLPTDKRFAAKLDQPDCVRNAEQANRTAKTVKVMDLECLVRQVSESRR